MLIQEKIGHIASFPVDGRAIDLLELEWFETGKRILRKRTAAGRELALKFLRESPALTQGDILYAGEKELIIVGILPCASIVFYPSSVFEIASVCYEIGNKHLPLFMEEEALLVPYEAPLFRQLQAQGYDVRKEDRQLLRSLKTTVAAHAHGGGRDGLLTKILQITNPNP
jgi:urease accessory protein